MHGRRVEVVKVKEGLAGGEFLRIDEPRPAFALFLELGLERREKHVGVEGVDALVDALAPRHEVDGSAHGRRRGDEGEVLSHVAHGLGELIRAETHPHRIKRRFGKAGVHGFEHPGIVRRVAREIGARQAVEFAPAGAEVRDHAAPTASEHLVHERERVVTPRTSLEAVKVHEHGSLGIRRFGFGPVPDHEVPVGELHVFDAVLHFGALGKFGGQTGLQM